MADRLREKDERLRQLREELETQLQQKELELQQRNADINSLQGQLQVISYISNKYFVHVYIMISTKSVFL